MATHPCRDTVLRESRKKRNRRQHALNGNTAALTELCRLRAAMLAPTVDEELAFLDLCAAFACMRVPWCVIKQRRRRASLASDLILASSAEVARECPVKGQVPAPCAILMRQASMPEENIPLRHPRYPQKRRVRRAFLSSYIGLALPDEPVGDSVRGSVLDFPTLAPVPLAAPVPLPRGAPAPQDCATQEKKPS